MTLIFFKIKSCASQMSLALYSYRLKTAIENTAPEIIYLLYEKQRANFLGNSTTCNFGGIKIEHPYYHLIWLDYKKNRIDKVSQFLILFCISQ